MKKVETVIYDQTVPRIILFSTVISIHIFQFHGQAGYDRAQRLHSDTSGVRFYADQIRV